VFTLPQRWSALWSTEGRKGSRCCSADRAVSQAANCWPAVAGSQSDTACPNYLKWTEQETIEPVECAAEPASGYGSHRKFQGTLHSLGLSTVPSELPDCATSQWPSTIPSWILHRTPLMHRPTYRPVENERGQSPTRIGSCSRSIWGPRPNPIGRLALLFWKRTQ
jgi:hypothetical protein